MALSYQSPGVYPVITDLSQIVQAASTSVGAAVGAAQRGSINKRLLISSSATYGNIFGDRNLKYGYMGHCMTAAFEEMRSAYIVRVAGENYKYAGIKIPQESTGGEYTPVEGGYTEAQLNGDIFSDDEETLMIIVGENPNELDIRVSLTETTELPKNNAALSVSGVAASKTITVTTNENNGLKTGDYVYITGSLDTGYNGKYKVTEASSNSFKYVTTNTITETAPTGLRWVRYPDNDMRTFDLSVYEVIDNVVTEIETYNNVTIYSGLNGYGQQTNVATVVNNNSRNIRVYLNTLITEDDNQVPNFPVMNEVPQKLTGGSLGNAITSTDISNGWDLFQNRDDVTVNLLINCGYVSESDIIVQTKMLSIAEERRDCFVINDIPYTATQASPETKAVDWRKNIQAIDSYRAALYSPWVKVYDTFSGQSDIALPPSGFIAQVIARRDRTRAPWYAPAGLTDGVIDCAELPVTGLTETYNRADQDLLYSNGINYLIRVPSTGYVVWGQKTQQIKASALDRINVSRLVITIETSLRDAARYYLFENNTAFTRAQVTEQFNNFLEDIQSKGGLYDFRVVCDETNNTSTVIDNNQLNIDIYLQPVKSIEFIKLQTVVTKTDADITTLVSTGGNF